MNFSLFRSSLKPADLHAMEKFAKGVKNKIETEGKFVHKSEQTMLSPFSSKVTVVSSEKGAGFRASLKKPTVDDYHAFAMNPENNGKIVVKTHGSTVEGGTLLSNGEKGAMVVRTETKVCFFDEEKKTIANDFVIALEEEQKAKEVTFAYSQKEVDAISEKGVSQERILKILATRKEVADDLGIDTWSDVEEAPEEGSDTIASENHRESLTSITSQEGLDDIKNHNSSHYFRGVPRFPLMEKQIKRDFNLERAKRVEEN